MPIKSEAAATAAAEATQWFALATEWLPDRHPNLWADLPATERDVVRYYRPDEDLEHRARRWGYRFGDRDLADLCRLGASLARAESEAWEAGNADIATRALEDRRFLLGDRLLHWAVPWLDAAARCHPSARETAEPARLTLLSIGDLLRPAPALTAGTEGLFVPGEDSYGALDPPAPLADYLLSVWSGRVVMAATIDSLSGTQRGHRVIPAAWLEHPQTRELVSMMFRVAAPRWQRVAAEHPGSARLWLDLAARADKTAGLLEQLR